MKISLNSKPRYLWCLAIGVLVATVLVIYFTIPKLPNTLKIAAGQPGSYFYETAEIYKKYLAKQGVELEIIQTKGAAESLALLNDDKVDLALAHGGLTTKKESPDLVSLGSISYEPLWVFQRKNTKILTDISQLKGMKVATGEKGTGVEVITSKIFKAEGVNEGNTTILHMGMKEAAERLIQGNIDAAVFMDPPENETIREFFSSSVINEVSLYDSEALRRRFRYLQVIKIPPSGIDLALEQPRSELLTIATTAYLATNKKLDAALQYLLLSIIDEVHHDPTLISDENEFPSDKDVDLPLSKDADIYYTKGKPFLQQYLPFQMASLFERLIKVLLPLLLLCAPIFAYAPAAYDWHFRQKLSKRYKSLVEIEEQLANNPSNKSVTEFEVMLSDVEKKLNDEKIPNSFTNQVFILREHIELVQRKIQRKMRG
jgi:TRAP-type uncharacterized transport system substrate-binding protein